LLSPVQILQKYWRYPSFRKPQEEIINTVLKQKDVIAVLPTGAGKSIIYQVAGLALGKITIVVSPLIALIEDQVNNLQKKGIKAIALTGTLNFSELERLLNNAQFGKAQFLFLSPERLQNEYVLKRLKQLQPGLISIDEAHCISEWGHDFRPSYLQLNIFKSLFPETPVLALTATAKNNVINDIKKYLELKSPVIFKKSVFRKNISYKVKYQTEKLHYIAQHLPKNETAIIYVKTRKQTYTYAQILAQQGFKTGYFHGGMLYEEKQKMLNEWLDNKRLIMFATTAFGMGIDKPDVRHIYHVDLPASLENYVQESGRAGRDGQHSEAVLLVSHDELVYLKENLHKKIPSVDEIYQVYKALYNHYYIAEGQGKNAVHNFDFALFCKRFKLEPHKTLQILQILDSEELIRYFQHQKNYHSLRILVNTHDIRQYIEQKRLGFHIINLLVRNYSEIFHLDTPVNIKNIAAKLDMTEKQITGFLSELNQRKIIDYQPAGKHHQIQFLTNRSESIFKFHQKNIEKRLKIKKEQILQVLAYAQNKNKCRSVFLATYFEEENPVLCRICDICESKKHNINDDQIIKKILKMLHEKCLDKHNIQKAFKIHIDIYLNYLIEQKQIYFSKEFKYCLFKTNY